MISRLVRPPAVRRATSYGAKKRPRLGRCWSSLPSSLRLCRLRCSSSSSRRWLGEPSPRRSDRLSPGGESGPPRTPGPSAASPDGRPASSTRCARSQTRPAGLDAGRGHRHPGYDPALVPETDRQEIRWQRPPTSRSTNDPTRRRRARGQDGGRQSAVGLHADPRRALKPRPHYRPDHGEADPARPRSRPGARAEPAHALEDVPAGALGGPGGLRSVHRRGVDAGGGSGGTSSSS